MTDEQSGNQKDGAHYEIYLGDYSGYFAGELRTMSLPIRSLISTAIFTIW